MLTFFFGTFCTTRFTACTLLRCATFFGAGLFAVVFCFVEFLVCPGLSFFTILFALYHTSSVYKTY